MNSAGGGRWKAWSAGSNPTGKVNPFALETLHRAGIDLADAPRSKSWDEFAGENAPLMDAVVTVCDNAARETCPVWPGKAGRAPATLHWSFPDPAAAAGSDDDKRAAFESVFADIRRHINDFLKEMD